jgi:prolycopene isomerase
MRNETTAVELRYDAIVAGAGMGGLAAGALLARAGKKVLVVERHDRPGGYAHGFERDGYQFDVAVHMISGAGKGGVLDALLRAVGARDACELIELDPIYTVVFPDFRLNVRAGFQGYIESHIERFPAEQDGLIGFLRLCSRINREAVRLTPDVSWIDDGIDTSIYPLHERYRHATVDDVAGEYIGDPHLRAVVASLWLYLGLPPSQLAFVDFATMLVAYLAAGTFYCRGSFQQLANAFAGALTQHGGELALGTDMERILVDDGAVRGVLLAGGRRVDAPVVISNVDAHETFERLVDPGEVDRTYLEYLDSLETSLSAAALYLGTDGPLPLDHETAHEIFAFDSWDHDEVFAALNEPRPASVSITVPSKVDAALAPADTDVVGLIALAPHDPDPPWDVQSTTSFQDAMIAAADKVVPGLEQHVALRVAGYPGTMERFTSNYRGAMYGWAHSPAQAAGYRLRRRTPIAGLFLAGHWTQPGSGVIPATVSGQLAAQHVLGYESREAMFATLTSPERPDASARAGRTSAT